MRPLTYYIQTDELDKLTERFGSQLELLGREQKLQLRAILTYFVLGQDMMGNEYSINDALIDSNQFLFVETPEIEKCIETLQGITVQEAESLQIALVEQCRTGNARLKNAVETMTDNFLGHGVPEELAKTAANILVTVDSVRERTPEEQGIIAQLHQTIDL